MTRYQEFRRQRYRHEGNQNLPYVELIEFIDLQAWNGALYGTVSDVRVLDLDGLEIKYLDLKADKLDAGMRALEAVEASLESHLIPEPGAESWV